MSKMGIAELARAVAAKHGISRESAEAFITSFFDVINDGLHTEKAVKVRGLGTFKVVDVRERESVNVNTGERVRIEGHGKVSYTPDPIMRDLVNKPFAKFETVVLNDGVRIDELNSVDASGIDEQPADDTDEEQQDADTAAADNDEDADNLGAETDGKEPDETSTADDDTHADDEDVKMSDEPEGEDNTDEPVSILPDEPQAERVDSILNNPVETAGEPERVAEPAAEPAEVTAESVDNEPRKDNTEVSDEGFCRRNKKYILSAAVLLLVVVSFGGGYLVGQKMASRPVYKTVKVYNFLKPKQQVSDSLQVADTTKPEEQPAVKDNVEPRSEGKTDGQAEANSSGSKRYAPVDGKELESARRYVKTGAYSITGTARTVTVMKGQTLSSISRQYLGEGMDCYVQVHNNVSAVSEGMRLRIPQLKLKKR